MDAFCSTCYRFCLYKLIAKYADLVHSDLQTDVHADSIQGTPPVLIAVTYA